MSYQDIGAVQGHTGGIFWFGAIAYVLSKILDSIRVLYAGLRKEVVKRVCIIVEFNTHDNIHQAEGINWAIVHDCFPSHDVWSGDKRRSWAYSSLTSSTAEVYCFREGRDVPGGLPVMKRNYLRYVVVLEKL